MIYPTVQNTITLERLIVFRLIENFPNISEPEGQITLQMIPPLRFVVNRINPIHTLTMCSCKIHFKIMVASLLIFFKVYCLCFSQLKYCIHSVTCSCVLNLCPSQIPHPISPYAISTPHSLLRLDLSSGPFPSDFPA